MSAAVTTSTDPTPADRARQVGVTLAEVFCVVGTLVGVGVIGTRVEESSGGALAADATLIAPAGPAFSIWTPIYLGLLAYTVWQWLPEQATDARHRAIGWLVAASMVLNAAWLLVTQQGWLWASVVVILALALSLGLLVRRLQQRPSYGTPRPSSSTAPSASTSAGSRSRRARTSPRPSSRAGSTPAVSSPSCSPSSCSGWPPRSASSSRAASVAGGRWRSAMAWGLGWIASGRLADEPESTLVASRRRRRGGRRALGTDPGARRARTA